MPYAKRPTGRKHHKPKTSHAHHAAKKPKLRKRHLWLGAAGLIGVIFGGLLLILFRATEGSVEAKLTGNKILPVNQPITITLNKDLRVRASQIKITPANAVDVAFVKGGFGETQLVVRPKKPLRNNQEYKITISGLQHIVSRRQVASQTFSFRTELAPGIAAFSPSSGTIKRDAQFSLVATDQRTAHRNYQLELEPKADLQSTFDGNTTWRWKPKQPLKQGVTYKVKLTRNKRLLQAASFQTVAEPKITTATAKHYFYPDEKITVVFDKPMQTNQTDALHFPIPGKGQWADEKTYIFAPEKLDRNQEYSYTFKAGFSSQDGGVIESDKTFKIKTPGTTTVAYASPYGSGLSRNVPIKFTFDQPVDHKSAEAHFRIEPKVNGSFQWDKNTLIFIPAGYDWQTTYTATILPGVISTYGMPGVAASTVRFSTEVQTKRLNVPVYRQTYRLSCEASALRMVLATYGIHSDDLTITNRMGYSPRPLTNGQWEDPYAQFVGDVNGKQWDKSGYGAYAPAVAKAARSYGRNASAAFSVGPNWIAEQIHAGRPVVVWGFQYTPTRFSWTTPNGQSIQAWQGEHTRTVVGVVGRADAPQGFYVADPSYGSVKYWSVGALMANMNVHGGLSNQAVVVY